MRDNALVVGIPILLRCSEMMYSRIEDLIGAFPSAKREYGVFPEPFSWSSYIFLFGNLRDSELAFGTSNKLCTLPSPSWPAN